MLLGSEKVLEKCFGCPGKSCNFFLSESVGTMLLPTVVQDF